MRIYNYDANGFFTGASLADESPLEPGVFLIPAFATELAPPDFGADQFAVFDGAAWSIHDTPAPNPEPEPGPESAAPGIGPLRQARLSLLQALATVDAAINLAESD